MLKYGTLSTEGLLRELRTQRAKVVHERTALRRKINEAQSRIDSLDARLRDIDHAEGMLR
jgi:phage shock protein A